MSTTSSYFFKQLSLSNAHYNTNKDYIQYNYIFRYYCLYRAPCWQSWEKSSLNKIKSIYLTWIFIETLYFSLMHIFILNASFKVYLQIQWNFFITDTNGEHKVSPIQKQAKEVEKLDLGNKVFLCIYSNCLFMKSMHSSTVTHHVNKILSYHIFLHHKSQKNLYIYYFEIHGLK